MRLDPSYKIIQWNRKGRKQVCFSGIYKGEAQAKGLLFDAGDHMITEYAGEQVNRSEQTFPAVTFQNSQGFLEILKKWMEEHEANACSQIGEDTEKDIWLLTESDAYLMIKELQKVNVIYLLSLCNQMELDGKEIRIFPENGIRLYPNIHLLTDLNGLAVKAFLGAVRFNFDIMIMPEGFPCLPMEEHCLGMYVEGQWYHLEMKSDVYEQNGNPEKTDPEILEKKLYQMIFRNQKVKEHVKLIYGCTKAKDTVVYADLCGGAVLLYYPTSISKLFQWIDQEKVFEQKIFDVDGFIIS